MGILICGTGIGMSIVANKFPGVRAALVTDAFMARMAKEHNNANILVLGGRVLDAGAGLPDGRRPGSMPPLRADAIRGGWTRSPSWKKMCEHGRI